MEKESCSTCGCGGKSLYIKLGLLSVIGLLFILASQNAFGEVAVSIPNEAGDPSCAENGTCFLPSDVSIGVGESVTWSNDGNTIHTVTSRNSDDSGGQFDSQIISSSTTFTHTFDKAGQFEYFCSIHPWMTGIVTVN